MTRVTIDPTTIAKLRQLSDPLEFCDEGGRLLGFFTPAAAKSAPREPEPLSNEELQRRLAETGGRMMAEILRDLESRS
jgi:hypothetical protein